MSRLAFSTLPFGGWSLKKIAAFARESGFSALELREGEEWSITVDMSSTERREVCALFDAAGLNVLDIGSNVCLKGRDSDHAMSKHFEKVARLAHDLKAQGVRIFLGHFNDRRDNEVPEISCESIIVSIRQACDYAASLGVQVWIETHNEFATGRILRKLLHDVDRVNCAIIYDIIHPIEEGEAPADTIAHLGDACALIHMKDGVPFVDPMKIDWEYKKIGEGALPIGNIISLLNQAGYKGYYSLEWETKWRRELQVPGMEPEAIFPDYVDYMKALSI
ncbi:sugar phosphate isomerase/epimerase [Paenibacillus sp. HB172176]|uniref:sugar phosphate isomerase/epimerase family protein n=1 Tax=Paenibacillus sp. HB172176 TaxID=2493690 RepID=UPI00143BE5EB|nr:sugar phosphate isomerase/epimerase [Paenibacillus sp. HB172176]